MSISLTEIMAVLQNGVEAMKDLTTQISDGVTAIDEATAQIAATFPQASALSTSATTGGISFNSSQPEAFLTVISASGGTYKVPLFLP